MHGMRMHDFVNCAALHSALSSRMNCYASSIAASLRITTRCDVMRVLVSTGGMEPHTPLRSLLVSSMDPRYSFKLAGLRTIRTMPSSADAELQGAGTHRPL
jgi:hypothetical protein